MVYAGGISGRRWPRVGQNERSERVDVLVRLIKRDNLYNPSLSNFWVVRKKGKGYGVAVCFIFLFLLKLITILIG